MSVFFQFFAEQAFDLIVPAAGAGRPETEESTPPDMPTITLIWLLSVISQRLTSSFKRGVFCQVLRPVASPCRLAIEAGSGNRFLVSVP